MENNPNEQDSVKRCWRQHFRSLGQEHRKTNCSPDRFKWSKSSLKREDQQILSRLKSLLSLSFPPPAPLSPLLQTQRAPLWLSYFPQCNEVDVRPLWQELPHFQWAFPSLSAFPPSSSSLPSSYSSSSPSSSSSWSSSPSDEGFPQNHPKPSFFQVHLSDPLMKRQMEEHMEEQMEGASHCRLQKNTYCIYAPKQECCKKVAIHDALGALVPGLAFDKKGQRLGRGGAYFDRALKNFQGLKVGLAYSWQWVDALPREEHDIPMDVILSENHLQAFTPQGKHFLKGML